MGGNNAWKSWLTWKKKTERTSLPEIFPRVIDQTLFPRVIDQTLIEKRVKMRWRRIRDAFDAGEIDLR